MKRFWSDEELAEYVFSKPYYWSTAKARVDFMEDYYATVRVLKVLRRRMTQELYQGICQNDKEHELLKFYNKAARHYAKLIQWLDRTSHLK